MFLLLLVATLLIAAAVSVAAAWAFSGSIHTILDRLVGGALAPAWARYVRFAILVVGVSGGVRVYDLERYIVPREPADLALTLTTDRWVLEVYRTLIGSLQSIAWMLLVFFLVALVAYVLVRGFELLHQKRADAPEKSSAS